MEVKRNHIKLIQDFYRSANDIIAVSNDNAVYGISKLDPYYNAAIVYATGFNEQNKLNVKEWRNVVKIKTGNISAVGLTSNGRLVTAGNTWCYTGEQSDLDVGSWSEIKDFSKSHASTAAIRDDGSVVAAGSNDFNEGNVSGFRDIVQVVSGVGFTAGLRSDGTVAFAGVDDVSHQTEGRSPGQTVHMRNLLKHSYDTSSWSHIVRLYSEPELDSLNERLYGLRDDGTVLAAGNLYDYQQTMSQWTDIVDLFAYFGKVIGIKSDGSIVTTYGTGSDEALLRELSANQHLLNDIVFAIPRRDWCVLLKADGTVISFGLPAEIAGEIKKWKNIVSVKSLDEADAVIIGLKANGEVVQTSYATRKTTDDEAMSKDLASGIFKDMSVYEKRYTIDTREWKLRQTELDAYMLSVSLLAEGDPAAAAGLLKTIDYFSNASVLLALRDGLLSVETVVDGVRKIHDSYTLVEFYTVFEHKEVFDKLCDLLGLFRDNAGALAYSEELRNEQLTLEQKLLSERERMLKKIDNLKREYSGLSGFSFKRKKEIKKELEECETYLSVLKG